MTVGKDFPAKTISEFIAVVKQKPGAYAYASAGAGSTTQVSSLLFLKSAGLDMVHVPYRGVGPAFTDLVGSQGAGNACPASPVELKPFIGSEQGEGRSASAAKQRSRYLPDVPTIVETLPSPFVATYNGLLAPKLMPKDIVDALSTALVDAGKDPGFLDKLAKIGVEPPGGTTPRKWRRKSPRRPMQWRRCRKRHCAEGNKNTCTPPRHSLSRGRTGLGPGVFRRAAPGEPAEHR